MAIKIPFKTAVFFIISFLPEPDTQMALGRQVRRKESQVRKAVKVKWKKHEKEKLFTSSFLRAIVREGGFIYFIKIKKTTTHIYILNVLCYDAL